MLEVVIEVDVGRCRPSAAMASCCPRPRARRRTHSQPAARWCGRASKRCWSYRSAPTPSSPGRSSSDPSHRSPSRCSSAPRRRRDLVRRSPHVRPAARRPGRSCASPTCRFDSPDCTRRPFTDRLVNKFQLPVTGWSGAAVEAPVIEEIAHPRPRGHRRSDPSARRRLHRRHRRDRRRQDHGRSPPSGCCSAPAPTPARCAPARSRPCGRGSTGSCPTTARSRSASREAGGEVERRRELAARAIGVVRRAQPSQSSAAAARRSGCSASSATNSSSCTVSPTSCGCVRRPHSAKRSTDSRAPALHEALEDLPSRVHRLANRSPHELDDLVEARDARVARGRGAARRPRRDRGGRSLSRAKTWSWPSAPSVSRTSKSCASRRAGARGSVRRARSSTTAGRGHPGRSARRHLDEAVGHDPALAPIGEALASSASCSPTSRGRARRLPRRARRRRGARARDRAGASRRARARSCARHGARSTTCSTSAATGGPGCSNSTATTTASPSSTPQSSRPSPRSTSSPPD